MWTKCGMEAKRLLLAVAIITQVLFTNGDYATEEEQLLTMLRQNYSTDHRPRQKTDIVCFLLPFALNKLDIGSEVMSLTSVLGCNWDDQRLAWDPTAHSGIETMVVPTKYVWRPAIIIENSASDVGVIGGDGVPLRIFARGAVMWGPPMATTTSCSVDITYYPYDKQTCMLIMTGWGYVTDEVELLTPPGTVVDPQYYNENGEWDLIDTDSELYNLTSENNTYRKLLFKLTFRRKWQFYGQNIIIPLVLNSFLMAMVFVVPLESGEKMGYCLTVLLSFIVLLTMVADNMPSISSQVSVIQMYLSAVICLGTAGVMCTIGVLHLYNKEDSKPVPYWLQMLTRHILAPITCRTCKDNKIDSSTIKKFESENFEHIYNYKEIAYLVDTFLFRLFALMILAMTLGFLLVLNHNYE